MKTSNVKTKRSVLAMILCTAVAFGGMIHDVPAKAEDNSTAVKWVRGVNDWGFFNSLQHLGDDYYWLYHKKRLSAIASQAKMLYNRYRRGGMTYGSKSG